LVFFLYSPPRPIIRSFPTRRSSDLTERAAIFRFTFPETDDAYVVIDALDKGSYVKVIPSEQKIIGYTTRNSGGVPENFKNYFVIHFDKPFTYQATVAESIIRPDELEAEENHAGAIV